MDVEIIFRGKPCIRLRQEQLFIIAGLAALWIGILVYFFDRPPERIYFIPEGFSLSKHLPPIFGPLGDYLPTFLHVYAVILFSTAILGQGMFLTPVICLGWLGVDGLFEVGQHPLVANMLLGYIPDWFQRLPILENTSLFFLNGTFDVLDTASIVAGVCAAYLTIFFVGKGRSRDAFQK